MKKVLKKLSFVALMMFTISFGAFDNTASASTLLEVTCCEGHSASLYYVSNKNAKTTFDINSSVYVDTSKAYVLSNTSTSTTVYVPSIDTEAFYSESANIAYTDAYSTTNGYFFKSNLVGEITASSSTIASYCCSNPMHTTGQIVGYNPHYDRDAVNDYNYLYAGLSSGSMFSLSTLDNRAFIATESSGYSSGVSTGACGDSVSTNKSCIASTDVQLTLDTYGEVTLTFDEHVVNGRNSPVSCNNPTTLVIRVDDVKPQVATASVLNGVVFMSASDNATGVSNYGYSYSNDTSSITWNSTTSFAVSSTDDIYLWAKDGVGNISETYYIPSIKTISTSNTTVSAISSYTYTGSSITPTPTVVYNGITLAKNTDYTLSYSNNTNAGTATVTITGMGTYEGSISKTFTISTRSVSDATFSTVSSYTYTYTGSAIIPTPTVTVGGRTLTSGTDYTISYSNNTSAGTATIKITGKGNYTSSSTASKTFTISTRTIADASFSGISSYAYTGSAITPTPTITAGGRTLVSGTDYTISYSNNTNVGTATIKITGKGNYTSSTTASTTFTIATRSVSDASFSGVSSYSYTGSAITPTPTVTVGGRTLTSGTDYSISYSNNVSVGTATITITGKGNYTSTSNAYATFIIGTRTISDATFSGISSYSYVGSAITPTPIVTVNGKTLTSGTDYSISYSNNINAGSGTITITGIGNYSSNTSTTFEISQKTLDENSVYISGIPTQQYTGVEIMPSFTIVDNLIGSILIQGYDYTISYLSNINVGTATAVVTGKGNYDGTITLPFSIINTSFGNTVDGTSIFISSNLSDRIYSTYGYLENEVFYSESGIYLDFYVLESNADEYLKATAKLNDKTYVITWDNCSEVIKSSGDIITGKLYIDSADFTTSLKNTEINITVSSYADETFYSKTAEITEDVIVTIDVKSPVLMVDVNKYSNKVSIESYDSIAGVYEILFSLNGGNYSPYTEAFNIDSDTETIDVYAVDNVQNESFYRENLVTTVVDTINTA
ncbi:MAG: hypothetical protein R3Y09_12120, partial [Clostridia bacterium]